MAENPFQELAALDRVVHDPARLAILTALSVCDSADFVYLRRLTGLTGGNLSSHLSRLEGAGMVTVVKEVAGRSVRTVVALTASGRAAVATYWAKLDHVRASVTGISPPPA